MSVAHPGLTAWPHSVAADLHKSTETISSSGDMLYSSHATAVDCAVRPPRHHNSTIPAERMAAWPRR